MNADHICRRFASRFGGEGETLYAPALVVDQKSCAVLLENDTVKRTLDHAQLALIGIGDISDDSNMVRMEWFTPAEIAAARQLGAIGNTMGCDFIDIARRPVETPFADRVMSLASDDLMRIPNVVAVASEITRTTATLGALRTGVVNTLATTEAIAQSVLTLDEATRVSHGTVAETTEAERED